MAVMAGQVEVICPVCEVLLPVPVSCRIEDSDGAHLGLARMVCTPDMADVHAHAWTHTEDS